MTVRVGVRASSAVILLSTIGLPLLGAWAARRDLSGVFSFPPPLHIPLRYPRWSWIAFALVVAPFAALSIAWMVERRRRTASERDLPTAVAMAGNIGPARGFPPWGLFAGAWTIGWWIFAWNRFPWFAVVQPYTFFPLWLGFVVSVNAITVAAGGRPLMLRSPAKWFALFVASAGFWWVFEWLNRFSQNWHYLGVAEFGPAAYAAHATLCFSTVLPAVTGVAELLNQSRSWRQSCARGPRLRWLDRPETGYVLIALGAAGLLGTGAAPVQFYAALWIAPLGLLLADDILGRRGQLAARVAHGNWHSTASWAVAAMICGFFWELWNSESAARWMYTVPYVDRWHVFAMPLLGYFGYQAFGLECYFVVSRLFPEEPFSSVSST